MKRLSELKEGERAEIISFESDDLFIKLMEMGCLPGEEVCIKKKSILQGPISIQVSGYCLSLRQDEAHHIFVKETDIKTNN